MFKLSARWQGKRPFAALFALLAMLALGGAGFASAQARTSPTGGDQQGVAARAPSLYVVNFTAQWCPNCTVTDPAIASAMKALGPASGAQLLVIDITDAQRWDASTERAIERGILPVFNGYIGLTGLIVLTAADTGERVSCLNRTHTAQIMKVEIERALERVRKTPPGQRDVGTVFCPPMRSLAK